MKEANDCVMTTVGGLKMISCAKKINKKIWLWFLQPLLARCLLEIPKITQNSPAQYNLTIFSYFTCWFSHESSDVSMAEPESSHRVNAANALSPQH